MVLGVMTRRIAVVLIFALSFLFGACDQGQLGDADKTESFSPGNAIFEERLNFMSGVWHSGYPGIGWLDSYRIRQWGSLTDEDKLCMQSLFSAYGFDINNAKTYKTGDVPQNTDYILLYDDTVYGQDDSSSATDGNWGFAYMGLVRAINIFNGDIDRGAIIIEYLEGCDPNWLWDPDGYKYQGLGRGEKPFFGVYYRVLGPDTVQMANAVDLAALYAGKHYYTEKGTLVEAIAANSVENEAEFISWGVVSPQQRDAQ
jgi:hypothetical protein